MSAHHTPGARIDMPYKVRIVGGPHGSPTRYRDGRTARVTNRYFATKAEAVAFCGDPRRVIYAPGEAWRAALAQSRHPDHPFVADLISMANDDPSLAKKDDE